MSAPDEPPKGEPAGGDQGFFGGEPPGPDEVRTPSVIVHGALDVEPLPPQLAAPPAATVDDLRVAVGARAPGAEPAAKKERPHKARPELRLDRDDDDDDGSDRGPGARRAIIALALALVLGMTITAFIFLGRANSGRYFIVCGADQITAEHGRSFPPWGSARLAGAEWRPIAIPPAAECEPHETTSLAALEGWYLDALVEQASGRLENGIGDVDAAETQLQQALLLTRAPERRDQRKDLERLLGDVAYWRAAARVKAALDILDDAARRYDDAVGRRPRHASDAASWAERVRAAAGALRGEVNADGGVPTVPAAEGTPRPSAPPGVALPLDLGPDAGVPEVAPADAGLPSGGVLL